MRETSTGFRTNENIKGVSRCRLIDENGEQAGILDMKTALEKADDAGLDLVEIAQSDPPVCRIMDYGKYKYERQKKERENKKKQASSPTKEMKFRVKIDTGDFNTKKKHIERFLENGSKVKVTIMFRGREQTHPELGFDILERLANEVSRTSIVTQAPKMEGRNMTMVLSPSQK